MRELIELLNNTSGERVFFYSIVFLIALGTVSTALVGIVNSIGRNIRRRDK